MSTHLIGHLPQPFHLRLSKHGKKGDRKNIRAMDGEESCGMSSCGHAAVITPVKSQQRWLSVQDMHEIKSLKNDVGGAPLGPTPHRGAIGNQC